MIRRNVFAVFAFESELLTGLPGAASRLRCVNTPLNHPAGKRRTLFERARLVGMVPKLKSLSTRNDRSVEGSTHVVDYFLARLCVGGSVGSGLHKWRRELFAAVLILAGLTSPRCQQGLEGRPCKAVDSGQFPAMEFGQSRIANHLCCLLVGDQIRVYHEVVQPRVVRILSKVLPEVTLPRLLLPKD